MRTWRRSGAVASVPVPSVDPVRAERSRDVRAQRPSTSLARTGWSSPPPKPARPVAPRHLAQAAPRSPRPGVSSDTASSTLVLPAPLSPDSRTNPGPGSISAAAWLRKSVRERRSAIIAPSSGRMRTTATFAGRRGRFSPEGDFDDRSVARMAALIRAGTMCERDMTAATWSSVRQSNRIKTANRLVGTPYHVESGPDVANRARDRRPRASLMRDFRNARRIERADKRVAHVMAPSAHYRVDGRSMFARSQCLRQRCADHVHCDMPGRPDRHAMRRRSQLACASHPHRHQHVERVALVILAQQGRGGGVGEVDFDAVAFDLAEDVHQIAGVEADLDAVAAIIGGDFLDREAVFGAGDATA